MTGSPDARPAAEATLLDDHVTAGLAREAADLLSIADGADVRSLHRLSELSVRQVAACSGASAALWRDGEPVELAATHPDLSALFDLCQAAGTGPWAEALATGDTRVLRGHPGGRPVAGLHPRGPAAGRPVQRHAGAHLRPDDRHADPVRRPAAGPGPGQGRGGRAADRVRRRHPGQRLDLRRDPAHRAPPARVGRVPDGGGPGQGHPDARAWLYGGRGVRPAAGDLADPARQGHRRGRDHHQGAPLGRPARPARRRRARAPPAAAAVPGSESPGPGQPAAGRRARGSRSGQAATRKPSASRSSPGRPAARRPPGSDRS